MKLKGKVALVTGGGRGLGRAYVLHLAKLGADVVVNDINLASAETYDESLTAGTVMDEVTALGQRTMGVEADVTDKGAVDQMVHDILAKFGRIDILVNNAVPYLIQKTVLVGRRIPMKPIIITLWMSILRARFIAVRRWGCR